MKNIQLHTSYLQPYIHTYICDGESQYFPPKIGARQMSILTTVTQYCTERSSQYNQARKINKRHLISASGLYPKQTHSNQERQTRVFRAALIITAKMKCNKLQLNIATQKNLRNIMLNLKRTFQKTTIYKNDIIFMVKHKHNETKCLILYNLS